MTPRSKSRSQAPTDRQRRILDYIVSFVSNEGRPPSLEEIRSHVKLAAVSTVHEHISHLVEKGYLSRQWNRTRSLGLTEDLGVSRASVLVPHRGQLSAGKPFPLSDGRGDIAVPALLTGMRTCIAVTVADDSFVSHEIRAGDTLVIKEVDVGSDGASDGGLMIVESGDGIKLIADGALPRAGVVGRVVGLIRRLT